MKKIALALFLLSSVAYVQAQDNATVSGKWKVHSSVEGNDSDANCTFTQKDSDLTGTCTDDQGTANLTGKVDGKNVAWVYDTQYDGSPLTVKFNGTLDSGKISGDVSVDQFGVSGDFSAIPST